MPELKLARIPDRTPVKLTITVLQRRRVLTAGKKWTV